MNKRTRIGAVGVGAALSLGLGLPALAQSTTTVAPTAAAATKTRPTQAERQAAEAARVSVFAGRLGVTVAKITEANKAQAKADVDKALAAGTINAAQAAAYKVLIDNDADGRGFGGPKFRAEGATEPTQAERDAQRLARLTEYTARLGVSIDAYTKASKDQAKADIDAAVTAGRITAAQATEMKARVDASTGLDGRGFGFGGGKGGRGGHGGGGDGPGRN
jgi:hypothetical protein